jgi:hypothetical protein
LDASHHQALTQTFSKAHAVEKKKSSLQDHAAWKFENSWYRLHAFQPVYFATHNKVCCLLWPIHLNSFQKGTCNQLLPKAAF